MTFLNKPVRRWAIGHDHRRRHRPRYSRSRRRGHLQADGRARAAGGPRRPGAQPRLGIVDAFDLDRQRQLVLVRRDNVEHLIMIGGPNDLLIEPAIVRAQPSSGAEPLRREPAQPPLAPAGNGGQERAAPRLQPYEQTRDTENRPKKWRAILRPRAISRLRAKRRRSVIFRRRATCSNARPRWTRPCRALRRRRLRCRVSPRPASRRLSPPRRVRRSARRREARGLRRRSGRCRRPHAQCHRRRRAIASAAEAGSAVPRARRRAASPARPRQSDAGRAVGPCAGTLGSAAPVGRYRLARGGNGEAARSSGLRAEDLRRVSRTSKRKTRPSGRVFHVARA